MGHKATVNKVYNDIHKHNQAQRDLLRDRIELLGMDQPRLIKEADQAHASKQAKQDALDDQNHKRNIQSKEAKASKEELKRLEEEMKEHQRILEDITERENQVNAHTDRHHNYI